MQRGALMRARCTRVTVLIIAFILVGYSVSYAQFAGGGIKGGVNFANLSGEHAESANTEAILGYMFGGYVRFSIGDRLSIQPEMHLSLKGAEGDTLWVHGTVDLYYLDFPILLRYDALRMENITSSIFAGPVVSYNLDANASTEYGGQEYTMDIGSSVKGYDVGFVFGVEAGMPMGKNMFTLETRYSMGLIKLDATEQDADFKNRGIIILIGLHFGV
jgi:hypothetical protein